MFLQSQKDIDNQVQRNDNVNLRVLKPKLISSLNYEQQYLMRRKQKRNNRRKSSRHSQTTGSDLMEKTNQNSYQINDQQTELENNFYKEVYDGNDKICGYWVNGLLEGQAEIEYNNGDYFKGRFQKGYKAEGLMVFKDQGSYEGGFYNEQFHGRGVLRLKEKTISAQWVNGLVESNCVVQYKNGNVYYGPLKDFKKYGYGYLYFPNDTKFFGQFVDGNVKGYGQYYEKGKLKCKGIWKNGKLIQQKKQQDWSYNFQQQNINWQLIEQIFNKHQNGLLNHFQLLNVNTRAFDKGQQSQSFSQRLNKIKNSGKSANNQHKNDGSNKESTVQYSEDGSVTSIIDITKIKLF